MSGERLLNFRREVDGKGVSSYPRPWLMPDYWQFPTVSMGLGPIQAIYMARFLKYLEARGIAETANRKVWVFCGDGEMDEPESLGAIGLASREKLDNLVFVVNCFAWPACLSSSRLARSCLRSFTSSAAAGHLRRACVSVTFQSTVKPEALTIAPHLFQSSCTTLWNSSGALPTGSMCSVTSFAGLAREQQTEHVRQAAGACGRIERLAPVRPRPLEVLLEALHGRAGTDRERDVRGCKQ